jgi:hypothetical protein
MNFFVFISAIVNAQVEIPQSLEGAVGIVSVTAYMPVDVIETLAADIGIPITEVVAAQVSIKVNAGNAIKNSSNSN